MQEPNSDIADSSARSSEASKARGTFACPICGWAEPHQHSGKQIVIYRADVKRDDGWISLARRRPWESGFYLIRGHQISVPAIDENNVSYNAYQRIHERDGYPAEVVEWNAGRQEFYLLHWSGNARIDGKEGRSPVVVQPTQWREIPASGSSTADTEFHAAAKLLGNTSLSDERDLIEELETAAILYGDSEPDSENEALRLRQMQEAKAALRALLAAQGVTFSEPRIAQAVARGIKTAIRTLSASSTGDTEGTSRIELNREQS